MLQDFYKFYRFLELYCICVVLLLLSFCCDTFSLEWTNWWFHVVPWIQGITVYISYWCLMKIVMTSVATLWKMPVTMWDSPGQEKQWCKHEQQSSLLRLKRPRWANPSCPPSPSSCRCSPPPSPPPPPSQRHPPPSSGGLPQTDAQTQAGLCRAEMRSPQRGERLSEGQESWWNNLLKSSSTPFHQVRCFSQQKAVAFIKFSFSQLLKELWCFGRPQRKYEMDTTHVLQNKVQISTTVQCYIHLLFVQTCIKLDYQFNWYRVMQLDCEL